jgi:hypothetical protein
MSNVLLAERLVRSHSTVWTNLWLRSNVLITLKWSITNTFSRCQDLCFLVTVIVTEEKSSHSFKIREIRFVSWESSLIEFLVGYFL